jgi:hypothetical protein
VLEETSNLLITTMGLDSFYRIKIMQSASDKKRVTTYLQIKKKNKEGTVIFKKVKISIKKIMTFYRILRHQHR